jgi:predicted Zn-dependent protease
LAAQILEQQRRPAEALILLERIPNDSKVAPDAVAAAVRCFAQQKDAEDKEIADWFERRIAPNTSWSNADVLSALESATYRLREKNADTAKTIEHRLRQLLKQRNDLLPTDKAKALASLVTSLTLQNRQTEASQILDQLTGDNFSSLPPAEQRNLLLTKARVLADIGKVQESLDITTGFLKEHPKDWDFRETLAEILSRQEQPEALAKALRQWKDLETQFPKNSERWWNAKEKSLSVLLKLGRNDEARTEYGVLRLLYPELGGTAMKMRFEAVLQ